MVVFRRGARSKQVKETRRSGRGRASTWGEVSARQGVRVVDRVVGRTHTFGRGGRGRHTTLACKHTCAPKGSS